MIPKDLFIFLSELKENNTREWFQDNKERYESEVRGPLLQFVREFESYLERISPYFMAEAKKSGGALFRIHRDVRFSKDKSPYKTNAGLHFRHENGKDAHAPGFYLHLEPGRCFCAAGLWKPDNESLRAIRDKIVGNPREWEKVVTPLRGELAGDSLKRAPKGYDPDHPLLDDLRRKDHVVMSDLAEKTILKPDYIKEYAGYCERVSDYMRFLCGALNQPFD